MPNCYLIRPNGTSQKVDHDKDTSPGNIFYYCSLHRVYHCVAAKFHRRLPQPTCGECAWLFFQFPKEATKYPESDIPAFASSEDEEMAVEAPFFHGHDFGYEYGATANVQDFGGDMGLHGNMPVSPTIEETLDALAHRARQSDKTQDGDSRKRVRFDSHDGSRSREFEFGPSPNE